MKRTIENWIDTICTDKFLEDIKWYYRYSKEDLAEFILEAGLEYVLTDSMEFHVTNVGSHSNPQIQTVTHLFELSLRSDNTVLHSKILEVETVAPHV